MSSAGLVTISYSVPQSKAREFETLMRDLVDRINNAQQGVKMGLFKSENGESNFVEVYDCDTPESFDSLEDNLDDDTRSMINRVAADFATARQIVTTMRRVI